jgi:hypothetical protein
MVFQVIGQEPQAPRGQGRQGGIPGQLQGPQNILQHRERVGLKNLGLPPLLPGNPAALGLQDQEGVPTHEGVAGAVQVAAA